MFKKVLLSLCILTSFQFFAQTAISGYVDTNLIDLNEEIHLTKIALEDIPNYDKAKKVAVTKINKNGFFEFKKKQIADKNAIYRLYINRFEKALKDTLQVEHLFLFSKKDSIRFKKSKIPFTQYVNSNTADNEWQKLRRYEQQLRKTDLKKEDSLSKGYIGKLKSYAKDSVQILMVKLIGIKQLDNKALLDKDIVKNTKYYVALLQELKESDIERSQYLFLENKLAFLTTEVAENKYATSKIVITFLGFIILGLVFFVLKSQKQKNKLAESNLSKQEKNMQGLILQGKSNKEIANELFISLSTVKTHITNIYSKLQVSNRKELLQKAHNS